MREEEEIARRLVECMLRVPVHQHDTNSGHSVPDLRIGYPDGRCAYVEVFGDPARHKWRELESVARSHLGDQGLPLPNCRYDWAVYLTETTGMNELLDRLPAMLTKAEEAGELFDHRVDATLRDRNLASPIGALVIRELGVDRIVAGRRCRGKAVANLVLPGAGGPADVDLARVVDWCDKLLSSHATIDIRQKLAMTGAEERHAFVVAGRGSEWAVLRALSPDSGLTLPARAPELPEELTHIWLLGTRPADRLLFWSHSAGWLNYQCQTRRGENDAHRTSCGIPTTSGGSERREVPAGPSRPKPSGPPV